METIIKTLKRMMAEREVMYEEWADLELGTDAELALFERIELHERATLEKLREFLETFEVQS